MERLPDEIDVIQEEIMENSNKVKLESKQLVRCHPGGGGVFKIQDWPDLEAEQILSMCFSYSFCQHRHQDQGSPTATLF